MLLGGRNNEILKKTELFNYLTLQKCEVLYSQIFSFKNIFYLFQKYFRIQMIRIITNKLLFLVFGFLGIIFVDQPQPPPPGPQEKIKIETYI